MTAATTAPVPTFVKLEDALPCVRQGAGGIMRGGPNCQALVKSESTETGWTIEISYTQNPELVPEEFPRPRRMLRFRGEKPRGWRKALYRLEWLPDPNQYPHHYAGLSGESLDYLIAALLVASEVLRELGWKATMIETVEDRVLECPEDPS